VRELLYFEPRAPLPRDYLASINPRDLEHIDEKIRVLCNTPVSDWGYKWCKILEDSIRQMRHGDHRVLFFATERRVVIVHACRKKGPTIARKDLTLALERMHEYQEAERTGDRK